MDVGQQPRPSEPGQVTDGRLHGPGKRVKIAGGDALAGLASRTDGIDLPNPDCVAIAGKGLTKTARVGQLGRDLLSVIVEFPQLTLLKTVRHEEDVQRCFPGKVVISGN